MDNIRAAWLYPIILAAGAFQAWGLAIDKYGWFGMSVHELNSGRVAGAASMVAGIILICRF